MTGISSPVVVCRPALPKDTADVLEFTKFIWDGHDYIPYVWNDWMKDSQGILAVAEYSGHAIGLAKVTLLAPGQWWFEGFRVDPKYQGLKVGSHIHEYVDDWWIQHGDGNVRLMTNSKNFPVHHLCEKLGFQKVGEMVKFVAEPLKEPIGNFTPIVDQTLKPPGAYDEAADFALESESINVANGLSDFGWRVMQPDEAALRQFTSAGPDFGHTALWWRNQQAMISTWDDDEDGEPMLGLGIVACDMKDLSALLMDARRLAGEKNCKNVMWIAYLNPDIIDALNEAGYERKWENSGFIYAKSHS